jgi:hypothetical protein
VTRISGTLYEGQYRFLIISHSVLFRMGNVSYKICRKIKTHFYVKTCFFSRKSFSLWDNVENIVKPGRPPMTIWRMRIACWIPTATDTLGVCNIYYCFSTTTVVTRTRISVTLNVHCLSCYHSLQCLNGSLKYRDGFLTHPCKFIGHRYPAISHLTLLNFSSAYSTIHV